MNVKIIATTVGILTAKIAKIGATQTAVQNLQSSNKKDMKDFMDGNNKPNLKVIKKEDLKATLNNSVPKSFAEVKEAAKEIGYGAGKIMKIGAQTQAIYSLNEMNRDEMKGIDGDIKRGIKYNVSPKLKNMATIKIKRGETV